MLPNPSSRGQDEKCLLFLKLFILSFIYWFICLVARRFYIYNFDVKPWQEFIYRFEYICAQNKDCGFCPWHWNKKRGDALMGGVSGWRNVYCKQNPSFFPHCLYLTIALTQAWKIASHSSAAIWKCCKCQTLLMWPSMRTHQELWKPQNVSFIHRNVWFVLLYAYMWLWAWDKKRV